MRRRSRNQFHPIVLLTCLSIVAFASVPAFARAADLGGKLLAILWALLVVPLVYGSIWVVSALLKTIGNRIGGTGDDQDLRLTLGYSLLAPLTLAPVVIALSYAAMIWPSLGPAAFAALLILAAILVFFLLINLAEAHDLSLPMSILLLLTTGLILFIVSAAVVGLFSRFLPLLTRG